jgi:GNAT superfamily N-acetyltransferase
MKDRCLGQHVSECCQANPAIIETWVKGWALARQTPPPVRKGSGFRVEVGWPQQLARYVFPALTDEFAQLAASITEPWIHLKVCAPPAAVRAVLPACWTIQPVGFLMTDFNATELDRACLPQGYSIETTEDKPVSVVSFFTPEGEVAAIGRVVFVEGYAIYDRIETHPSHRRRGLGRAVMQALKAIGEARGKTDGILVATQEGKALYQTLGWQVHALYTTAVILPQATSAVVGP